MAQADLMQSWADTEFNTFQVEGVKDLLDDICLPTFIHFI